METRQDLALVLRQLKERNVSYPDDTIKFLLEHNINFDEIVNWSQVHHITKDEIQSAIRNFNTTHQPGLNFSAENVNGLRVNVALARGLDNRALIPALNSDTRPSDYTRQLRKGGEGETYRTETDMSIMVSLFKKHLLKLGIMQRQTANFSYITRGGEHRDELHTYEVSRNGQGNFVLTQPVKSENSAIRLLKEIQDYKDSGLFGTEGKEVLTFLVPQTDGGHWTLSVYHVSFPDLTIVEKNIDSLRDGRQKDGWSCGIHAMEAVYSLATGEKLETADGKSIVELYPNVMNISTLEGERSERHESADRGESVEVLRPKSEELGLYSKKLGVDYIQSQKINLEIEKQQIENIVSSLEFEKNIKNYSEDLLSDSDLMQDVIANIIKAHKEGVNQKEVIQNAKEMLIGR